MTVASVVGAIVSSVEDGDTVGISVGVSVGKTVGEAVGATVKVGGDPVGLNVGEAKHCGTSQEQVHRGWET